MKVLLVNPASQVKLDVRSISPPLGLLYLASIANTRGHDVKVIDMRPKEEKPTEIKRYINSFQPEVIGISGMTTDYPFCLELINESKKLNPNIITLMGGPHVTFTSIEVMERNKGVDIVVRGEGENTFLELLEAFSYSSSLHRVKGITFREKGKIISTKKRPPIKFINELKYPDRNLVCLKDYTHISMITSRGCPYRCIFCSTRRMWGSLYRARSPESVVDEMQYIKEDIGSNQIVFSDDLFTLNRERTRAICEEIIKRKLDLSWGCSTRLDRLDKDLVRLMKKSGCNEIYLGIESGNQKTLTMINKDMTVNATRKTIKMLDEENVPYTASFIIGFPWEEISDIRETLDFAREINANKIQFHFPVPYPGTEFREKMEHFGGKIKQLGWENYDGTIPLVKTQIPEEALYQLYEEGILLMSDDKIIINIL